MYHVGYDTEFIFSDHFHIGTFSIVSNLFYLSSVKFRHGQGQQHTGIRCCRNSLVSKPKFVFEPYPGEKIKLKNRQKMTMKIMTCTPSQWDENVDQSGSKN